MLSQRLAAFSDRQAHQGGLSHQGNKAGTTTIVLAFAAAHQLADGPTRTLSARTCGW
jgi:hypothetical protein